MILIEQAEIIRRHQKEPPVETIPIANDLGLRVYRTKPDVWPEDISGLIKKVPEDAESYVIYVNGDHPVKRRRFTIAHEIAHFILHKHQIGDGIVDDVLYRSGLSNHMEAQANEWAANILMPWHLLDAELDKGIADIGELAGIFNVAKSAMAIRLGVPY